MKLPLVMLPYVSGVSKDIRCVCSRYNLRVIFKSGQALRTMLIMVKDTDFPKRSTPRLSTRSPVKVYNNIVRRLETRQKSTKTLTRI